MDPRSKMPEKSDLPDLKEGMRNNCKPALLPFTDFPEYVLLIIITSFSSFSDLKLRFAELKDSVARVVIEMYNVGIQVTAENDQRNGFVFICKAAPGDFPASFKLINGGRSDEWRTFTNRPGNFIIEAARALCEFLVHVDEETVIHKLELSIDRETDEKGKLVKAEEIWYDYRFVKYNFLMQLELSCLMKLRPLKINKICIECRGKWESRYDVWSLLPYVKLVGGKKLFFSASESRRNKRTELILDRLFVMPDNIKPERVFAAYQFWTKVDAEQWAKFKEIRMTCKELSVDSVTALVQNFCQSAIFEKCTITLLRENPAIRETYNNIYIQNDGRDEWSVPNETFRLIVGIKGKKYTFKKVSESVSD